MPSFAVFREAVFCIKRISILSMYLFMRSVIFAEYHLLNFDTQRGFSAEAHVPTYNAITCASTKVSCCRRTDQIYRVHFCSVQYAIVCSDSRICIVITALRSLPLDPTFLVLKVVTLAQTS